MINYILKGKVDICESLIGAVRRGDIGAIRSALADGENVNILHIRSAVDKDDVATLSYLMSVWPDFIVEYPRRLHEITGDAIREGNNNAVEYLLHTGVDLNAVMAGTILLRSAIGAKNKEAIKLLLDNGAREYYRVPGGPDYYSLVHVVNTSNIESIIPMMVQKYKFDPNVNDGYPLRTAIRNVDLGIVDLLLDLGADPDSMSGRIWWNTLEMISRSRSPRSRQLLMRLRDTHSSPEPLWVGNWLDDDR
jgi:hypothetical protein